MDKRVFWVWLQNAVGAGWPHTGRLLRTFGSADRVWLADDAALYAAGVINEAVRQRLMNKTLDRAGKQLREALARGWTVLTPNMEGFPASWADLPDMPLVIYGTGPLPADMKNRLTLSLIATRDITDEGRIHTGKMAAGLSAAGAIVVGDTIAGGDAAVMAAVASVGGLGILLQPCGLDVSYPKSTERIREEVLEAGGIMLSEFPAGTPVRRENYAVRNRLLATLSDAIVVTEAGLNSGTLKVAAMAIAAGHEVLAVPGDRSCYAGCHRLIREGALLVENGEDVAKEFADRYPSLDIAGISETERHYVQRKPAKPVKEKPKKPPRPPRKKRLTVIRPPEPDPRPLPEVADLPAGLSSEAKTIALQLTFEPKGTEELAEKTPLSLPQAMKALTELELYGVAESHVGGRYSRKG